MRGAFHEIRYVVSQNYHHGQCNNSLSHFMQQPYFVLDIPGLSTDRQRACETVTTHRTRLLGSRMFMLVPFILVSAKAFANKQTILVIAPNI